MPPTVKIIWILMNSTYSILFDEQYCRQLTAPLWLPTVDFELDVPLDRSSAVTVASRPPQNPAAPSFLSSKQHVRQLPPKLYVALGKFCKAS
jgi:hypothetical protein